MTTLSSKVSLKLTIKDAYVLDDGEFITIAVYNYVDENFLCDVFNLSSFDEVVNNQIESIDESNTNPLNLKLLNVINQLRIDNRGITQPTRLYLIE